MRVKSCDRSKNRSAPEQIWHICAQARDVQVDVHAKAMRVKMVKSEQKEKLRRFLYFHTCKSAAELLVVFGSGWSVEFAGDTSHFLD